MTDRIGPDGVGTRPRARQPMVGPLRALVATFVVVSVVSVACQDASPTPSSSPSGSAAQSPSSPPSPSGSTAAATASAASTPSGSSPAAHGAVFIGLVELAAEDPSPGGTYIVIENEGATPADIGCWRLSTTTREDLRIPTGSSVPAGGALRLLFDRGAVANPDRLELRDSTGRVIDATPDLEDSAGDDQLFSRVGDEWVLGRPSLPSPLVDGGSIGPGGC
jgi:hypothetical protein